MTHGARRCRTGTEASSRLIEALMTHVLMVTNTAYWNVNQSRWARGDESNVERYPPMQLGDVLVTHQESDGGILFQYHFGDLTVSTWFDSKRPFYHSDLSHDMTRYEMVDWFERLMDHLRGLTGQSLTLCEWIRERATYSVERYGAAGLVRVFR